MQKLPAIVARRRLVEEELALVANLPLEALLERAVPLPPPVAPDRVGPFRVLGVLGSGGIGVVYLAEQRRALAAGLAVSSQTG